MIRARVTNTLRDFGIRDEIQVPLPVARLDVLEAVPLLGHREQRLREKLELFGVHAQLARAGAKEVAFHPDDIAQIHAA